jgi:hypothetical protein
MNDGMGGTQGKGTPRKTHQRASYEDNFRPDDIQSGNAPDIGQRSLPILKNEEGHGCSRRVVRIMDADP